MGPRELRIPSILMEVQMSAGDLGPSRRDGALFEESSKHVTDFKRTVLGWLSGFRLWHSGLLRVESALHQLGSLTPGAPDPVALATYK